MELVTFSPQVCRALTALSEDSDQLLFVWTAECEHLQETLCTSVCVNLQGTASLCVYSSVYNYKDLLSTTSKPHLQWRNNVGGSPPLPQSRFTRLCSLYVPNMVSPIPPGVLTECLLPLYLHAHATYWYIVHMYTAAAIWCIYWTLK